MIQFYTLHQYLQSFDNLEDVPVMDPAERAYDAEDEDGIDTRSDFRVSPLDAVEMYGDFSAPTSSFIPHIDNTDDSAASAAEPAGAADE